jgi:ATP-binding cassette subfamily B protein
MRFSIAGYWDLLRTYLLPSWRQFLLLGGLLVSTIVLHLINPQLVRIFIDTALAQGPLRTLTTLALLFLGTAVLVQIVAVAEAYVAEHVGVTTTNRLRVDLLAHCLRLDADFHSAHPPGELVQRIDGEVSALGNFFSRFVIQLLGNGLLLLAILALSFGLDWRAGLVLSAFTLLTVLVIDRLRDLGVQPWAAASAADAEMAGFLEERLSGLEDIRANGAPAYIM